MEFFSLLCGLQKKKKRAFCLFLGFLSVSLSLKKILFGLLPHRSDWSRCERSWPHLWRTASDVTAGCHLRNIILSHGGKCATKARLSHTVAAVEGEILNYWLLHLLQSFCLSLSHPHPDLGFAGSFSRGQLVGKTWKSAHWGHLCPKDDKAIQTSLLSGYLHLPWNTRLFSLATELSLYWYKSISLGASWWSIELGSISWLQKNTDKQFSLC